MTTRLLRVDAERPEAAAIEAAAATLRAGGLVAFPTETFYGLGAAVSRPDAVERVFAAKGRPAAMPLLVLVDSEAMAAAIADVPPAARPLMGRHWPGPLTLVMPARAHLAAAVTAGTGTVGVRLPAHAVARALVTAVGEPVTAPSANVTGAPPVTTAAEVLAAFDGAIDMVLDGGPTPGGPPSTVLDVTVVPPRVLRAGAVPVGGDGTGEGAGR